MQGGGTTLIENDTAAGMTATAAGTMTAASTDGVSFSPGGQTGDPAIRLGSLELGYEDLLVIVFVVETVSTLVLILVEVLG
jgi:hypothetical protein